MLEMLTKCVSVERPTPQKDSAGGITTPQVFTELYSNVACSIQPASDATIIFYSAAQIQVTHCLYTNQILSLQPGDQIYYGSRTLIVQGFRNMVELGLLFCVDCQEIVLT
jgi:hypothetical protein